MDQNAGIEPSQLATVVLGVLLGRSVLLGISHAAIMRLILLARQWGLLGILSSFAMCRNLNSAILVLAYHVLRLCGYFAPFRRFRQNVVVRLVVGVYELATSRRIDIVLAYGTLFCQFEPLAVLLVFFAAFRRLLSREGGDDENITNCFINGGFVITYVITCIICHNISEVWQFLKVILGITFMLLVYVSVLLFSWQVTMRLTGQPARDLTTSLSAIGHWTARSFVLLFRMAISLIRLAIFALRPILRRIWQVLFGCYSMILSQSGERTIPLGDIKPQYWYGPLQGSREMRLLHVSRAYPFAPVDCEIIHVPIDNPPVYEAISYTWGNPQLCHDIKLGKLRLGVTATVHQVIHARASYVQPRFLWIDQVCINQDDLDEKSICVRQMRDIYKKANSVLLWLGDAPDAQEAMAYLARLSRRLGLNLSDAERKNILEIGTNHPGWPALFNLFCHPYWSRIWIVQEIAVASTIYVSYGGEYVTWDYFSGIIRSLYEPSLGSKFVLTKADHIPERFPVEEFQYILRIVNYRDRYQQNTILSLLDYLIDFRKSKSTNDKDKVYGLLGISASADDPILQPSYRKMTADVYVDVAKSCLGQENFLLVLHVAGIGYPRSNLPGLPSWAPDWSMPSSPIVLWKSAPVAFARRTPTDNGSSIIVPNLPAIILKGICLDTIEELGPVFWGGSSLLSATHQAAADFIATYQLGTSRGPGLYHNGQTQFEAFWRTLIGDQVLEIVPAPDIYGEYFNASKRVYESIEPSNHSLILQHYSQGAEKEPQMETVVEKIRVDQAASGKFFHAMGPCARGRRFAFTTRGYMTMVPPLTEAGDMVCIINGGQAPFLLRRIQPRETNGAILGLDCALVGECYVHGITDLEIEAKNGELQSYVVW